MSISLAEALQMVKLEAGKTYRCKTREHLIEVRVLEREQDTSALPEADVMLDAWVELPSPPGGTPVPTRPGKPELPDAPDIPNDEVGE